MQKVKVRGQRSRSQRSKRILPQFGHFQTVTLVPQMATKWSTKLEWHRRGALLFFKVIHQISRSHGPKSRWFWPELNVSRWQLQFELTYMLWNDTQCLKWHTSGALLFFEVICKISRSHMPKNWQFCSNLSISGWQLQFEFTDGYEMTHIASRGMGEVPYCFSRSSAKFRGHTGWKTNVWSWYTFVLNKSL